MFLMSDQAPLALFVSCSSSLSAETATQDFGLCSWRSSNVNERQYLETNRREREREREASMSASLFCTPSFVLYTQKRRDRKKEHAEQGIKKKPRENIFCSSFCLANCSSQSVFVLFRSFTSSFPRSPLISHLSLPCIPFHLSWFFSCTIMYCSTHSPSLSVTFLCVLLLLCWKSTFASWESVTHLFFLCRIHSIPFLWLQWCLPLMPYIPRIPTIIFLSFSVLAANVTQDRLSFLSILLLHLTLACHWGEARK